MNAGDHRPADAAASPPAGRWRRRLAVAAAVVAVAAFALTVLPKYAVRHVLTAELDRLGIAADGLGTLHVDLWSQAIWFGPVRLAVGDRPPARFVELGVRLDGWALLQRRAVVETVIVEGLDIAVARAEDGRLVVNGMSLADVLPAGEAEPPAVDGDDPWGVELADFELRDSRFTFTAALGGTLDVGIVRLDLEGFRSWQPDRPGAFALDGTVNGIGFRLQGEARPFTEPVAITGRAEIEDARLEGVERFTGPLGFARREAVLDAIADLGLTVSRDGRLDARIDGTVALEDVDLGRDDGLDIAADRMSLAIDAEVTSAAARTLKASGTASVDVESGRLSVGDDFSVSMDSLGVRAADARGGLGADGAWRAEAAPDVVVTGVAVSGPLSATARRVAAQVGEARVSATADRTTITAAADLQVEAVEARDVTLGAAGPIAAGVARINGWIEELEVGVGDEATTWRAALDADVTALGASLPEETETRLDLGRVVVDGLRLAGDGTVVGRSLDIGALRIEATDRALARLAGGTTEPAGGGGAAVRFDRIALIDPARIRFRDTATTPPVGADLAIETLVVEGLDTGDPGAALSLDLRGTVNEFAAVEVSGSARPFAARPAFDLDVGVRNLELHPLSPYAARFAGTRIDSGRLTATGDAKATDGVLDSAIDVELSDIAFEPLSAEDAAALTETIGLPIETVVGLLQDADGRIRLNLPVTGPLESPDVNIDEAVNKAVGSVLTSLFPPTAIVKMLASAGGGGGMTFEPVTFAPDAEILDGAAKAYLDDVAALLRGHPKLAIRVCGRATRADVEARAARLAAAPDSGKATEKKPEPSAAAPGDDLDGALAALAADRTAAVRRYLTTEGGVETERVGECRASVDAEDAGPPRVRVSL